jgi:hypothetical protein
MKGYILPNENVDYLDDLLLDNGFLQVRPAAVLSAIPQVHLSIWGNKRGVYCLPTVELIDWLRDRIAGRTAIEICSGNGAIGRALGIPRTDSYNQTTPQMLAYYRLYNQTPIFPPDDVQKFEANEAVDHFKPEVVIGSYVTQKYIPSDEGVVGSSLFGVDEIALVPKVKTYITIGNESSHGDKRICQRAHKVFRFPWLFTRTMEPEGNGIYVWGA